MDFGDFDGDGYADVMIANDALPPTVYVSRGLGKLPFERWATTNSSVGASHTVVADFNGDSHLDILALRNAFLGPAVLLGGSSVLEVVNASMAGYNETFQSNNMGINMAAGDFDGDGDVDAVVAGRNSQANPVTVFLENDGSGVMSYRATPGVPESTLPSCCAATAPGTLPTRAPRCALETTLRAPSGT